MFACSVRGCRYPSTHVAAGHRCGTCGRRGHGQIECGNAAAIATLAQDTQTVPLDLRCAVVGCPCWETHTTSAHYCDECGHLGGTHGVGCAGAPNHEHAAVRCPVCREKNVCNLEEKPVYVDAECVVCYERKPLVVYPVCRHVAVCVACTRALSCSAV